MLANIFRKLNAERRLILHKFLIDKHTLSTILNTDFQLYCRYESNVFNLSGKQSGSIFSPSKNIIRHSTSLAIENKELFAKIPLSHTYLRTQLPDDEVEKLLKLDWASLSSAELVFHFERLTLYTCSLDKKPAINYDNFLQALSAMSPNFDDDEIAHILKYLVSWYRNPDIPEDVIKKIIQTLDKELTNRFSKQNFENIFMFSYLFLSLRYGKESHFTRKSIRKLSAKAKRLSPSQLAHYMNLLSVCRNLSVNLYEIEYHIEKNMESFSTEEFSKILTGFYKNRTQIKSVKLLIHILKNMLNNMEVMSTHAVSAFSKGLRKSYKSSDEFDILLRQVLKDLEPQVPRLTLKTLAHVSQLAAHVFIHEKGLMTSIFKRYDEEIKNATVNDMERISLSLAHFNYDSSHPLYKKILEEISSPRRQQEIEEHRKSLSYTLTHLALVNIYPIKLLEQALDPEIIDTKFRSKYSVNEEFFFLDQSIAAEVPNYTGPRLSDELRHFLAQRHKKILYAESRNYQQSNAMKEIVATCQRILKTTSGVFTDKILPHFISQDIIICVNEQNNPISPEPILSTMSPDSVKPVPEEVKTYKWFAIIVTTRHMLLKDSNEFTGILAAKYRQLKSLGYTPIVVSHLKWYDMKSQTDYEKLQEDYVKTLLNIE